MGLLDGKVAIVTGAGGGLGRSHALQLAREGALLVINDLGGARDGVGTSTAAAEMVAEEIRAAGGKAVADFNNVATEEGAAAIAKSALDAFGRIDILVNNAGILRDKTFVKMTRDQWDAVIAVHLTGTMLVTRACLPALMESGNGSIINTTSIAGLKGNYGQSNYAAAKAGIWSFTNVLAMEIGRSGVRANCIAPIAKTRMTEDIDIVADDQKPEYVSPMVVFLASDLAAEVTGRTFGCHGAEIIEYKMLLTPGAQREDGHWTAQEIARRLPEIEALSVGAAPAPAAAPAAAAPATPTQVTDEVFSRMGEAFLPEKGAGWTANLLFDIKGIGEYSVAISGGSVTTAKGKVGEPTCVINFASGDTFIDIVMGKEKAEKAFMAGKIKASNMADLMRYATSFDMTKGAKEIAARMAAPAAAPAPVAAAAPAAAAPSPSAVTDEVFSRMGEAFLPEKGAGWTANLLFDIKGIGEYSVAISGGSVTTAKGKVGEPTCVINFASGDTFIDIVMGKEKAEKAFMAGKIKASNMADLMRYATSFDMTKGAKEIAARMAAPAAAPAPVAAAAPAAAPSPSAVTDEVFSRMGEAFLPEKGAGWTANLLFDIKGIGEYSVEIGGGSVKTAKGKVGTPTCVINFASGDTFIDIVMGKEKAEKAFMAGKIKASNMADLMRYATSFDMTKGAKEIAARLAAPVAAPAPVAAAPAAPAAPRSPVGLRYREPAEFARAADIEAYAKATRDSNPRYAAGADQIAPPLFAVRAVHKLAQGAVMDRSLDLDLGRLVHGEQEMTFHQVLRPWDLMTPRGQLLKVEEKASGKVIELGQTIFVDGAAAVEIVSRYFIRGNKSGGSSEPVAEPDRGAPIFTSTATLEPGQTVDYAAASRDDNPIHTDEGIAKAVGFPSVIGHGLLTMAFVQRGVIDNLLAGEAANLKRLKVRFSKPVLPGDEITTRGWLKSEANGRRIIEIESVNQRGEKVITNGEAELV